MSNIRPLHDRVIVKRVKEEEKTKGGIIIPDTAKEKPIEGEVIAVGNGKVLEDGKRPQARREGRRPRPVRQVLRHRGQGRRRRAPDPARGRHPRRAREVSSPPPDCRKELEEHGCQGNRLHRATRATSSSRASTPSPTRSRSPSAPRAATSSSRRASARPTVTKDGVTVAKEIELENRFENMGAQMVREVASQDQRRGRRRHHDRHRARPGHLPRGQQARRGRPQPDGDQARHRQGRRGRRRDA